MAFSKANSSGHNRGSSSNGRALASHARGTGIDAPVLQKEKEREERRRGKNTILPKEERGGAAHLRESDAEVLQPETMQ